MSRAERHPRVSRSRLLAVIEAARQGGMPIAALEVGADGTIRILTEAKDAASTPLHPLPIADLREPGAW